MRVVDYGCATTCPKKYTPKARTWLYEYNSTLVYGGDKGQFIDKANDLLETLRIERRKVFSNWYHGYLKLT